MPSRPILAAAMMAMLLLAASQHVAGQQQPDNSPGGGTNMPVDVDDPKPTGRNAVKFQHVDSRSVIPNEYLVKLTFGSSATAFTKTAVTAADARIQRTAELPMTSLDFPTGLKIRILQVSARNVKQSLQALVDDPAVEIVSPNAKVNATQISSQPISSANLWGLDRIDQFEPISPTSARYSYTSTGSGAFVYVLDTGIRASHADLVGRVEAGTTFVRSRSGSADDNGHGTHCAGTIGGRTYGVAKQVRLVPVKVLDRSGSGSFAGIVEGVHWAVRHTATQNCKKVISMSLGGGRNTVLDDAVTAAYNAGVTVVVAAGNENTDACNSSPAGAAAAVTVAATGSNDARASYSNFGRCVDIFAPGSGILSAWHTSNTNTAVLSGTSMAAPHVAGLAARLISGFGAGCPACEGQANPAGCVWSLLQQNANPNVVTGAGSGSPNLLALLQPTQ